MSIKLTELQSAVKEINKAKFPDDADASATVADNGGISLNIVYKVGEHVQNESVTASPPYDWPDFGRRLSDIAIEVRKHAKKE